MNSTFKILSILISLMIVFSTNAKAQPSEYENCPRTSIKYWAEGGNYVVQPSRAGPYDTIAEVEDAFIAASEGPDRVYTHRELPWHPGQWDLYTPSDLRHYDAHAIIAPREFCPEGFFIQNSLYCILISTGKCDCPEGTKLKPTESKCVPVRPAPDEPDPAKDKGPDCPNGSGEPSQPQCGNPINPNNGNKIQIESDFALPGSAGPLSMLRTYNSSPNVQAKLPGSFMFGRNWTSPFEYRLIRDTNLKKIQCYIWQDDSTKACEYSNDLNASPNSGAMFVRPDGRVVEFSFDSAKMKYSAHPEIKDQLILFSDASWHLKFVQDSDKTTYDYNIYNNHATEIRKVNGTALRVTTLPSFVNDSNLNRVPATAPICNHVQPGFLLAAPRIACITDDWGRQINFEYEQLPDDRNAARVTKVFDPAGNEYQYAYDGPTGGCIDNIYYNKAYNRSCYANNLTSVTYPNGGVRYYHYNERSHINAGAICPGAVATVAEFGNLPNALTGITDENGVRFASWTYDCAGRATSSEHAGGAERVEIAYEDADAQGIKRSVVKTITGPFESPEITFNVLTAQIINGRSKNISSDGACPGCGAALQRTYDVNGNISSFTDQNNYISKFEYDLSRNLQISRIEAFGTPNARKISTVWHAEYNKPIQIFKPLQITTLTYDASGNVLTRSIQSTSDTNGMSGTNALGTGLKKTWTYTYNQYGQVTSMTSPRSDVVDRTSRSYDEHGNIASVTNALNHSTSYSNYDMNGRVGTITSANGSISTVSYTPRGQVSRMETNYGTTIESTSYEYDNVGQVRKISTTDGTFIDLHYDDAHRLVRATNSAGDSVDYILDIQGNRIGERTKTIDGTLVRNISRAFDALNQLQQVIGDSN
jgi:YD repeat-containing protein